jgi:hypothetical protein
MTIARRLQGVTIGAHQALSIAALVWIVISGPFVAIDTITNLTNWRGFLFASGQSWSVEFAHLVRDVPFASNVPVWAYGLLYLFTFLGTMVWYYLHAVALEARRLYAAAIAGPLEAVEPAPEGTDGLELAAAGVAVVTNVATISMLKIATATGAAVGGPPGLVIGLAIGSVLAFFGLASRSERKKQEANAHAEQQTKRLEAIREKRARDNADKFRHNGAINLMIAGVIATAIVIIDFAGPFVRQLVQRWL